MNEVDRVKLIVETWVFERAHDREFNRRDMRRFIEIMNDRTRMLIRTCKSYQPIFYEDLSRVADDAETLCREGNVATFDKIGGPRIIAARALATEFGVDQADFYSGLMELCVHAATLTTKGARVIADGVDRTNV